MSDIDRVSKQYASYLAKEGGKALLHGLFPRDFEYYLMALELVDSEDKTIEYFNFPIMPSNISKSENTRVNVKKTSTSTVVINSRHYTPNDISIKGDFGKTFKILIKPNLETSFKAMRYKFESGVYNSYDSITTANKKIPEISQSVKTGYGCIKILQGIISKANMVDDKGKPFKLFMYNLALGESYLVVPTSNPLILQQDENRNNMIWGYTLNMTIVSEVATKKGNKNSLSQILKASVAQKVANKAATDVKNFVTSRA